MKTRRVEIWLEPELVHEIDTARGDVARQRWITRAIEERLRAEGFELDVGHAPAEVVPIRPGLRVTKKATPQREKTRQRARPTGTWRR